MTAQEKLQRYVDQGGKVYDTAPDGFRKIEGAATPVPGFSLYSNGQSHFNGKRETVLVKDWPKVFYISRVGNQYPVCGSETTTLEMVFNSEKCFFEPGARILIEDDSGNYKIFEKGV